MEVSSNSRTSTRRFDLEADPLLLRFSPSATTWLSIGAITEMIIMFGYTLILVEFCSRYLLDKPCKQWSPFAWIGTLRQRRRSTSSSLSIPMPLTSTCSTSELNGKSEAGASSGFDLSEEREASPDLFGALAGSTWGSLFPSEFLLYA